jgi:rare lipoprotein A
MKLGITRGVAPVELARITHEAIRTGSWRRGGEAVAQAAAPPATPVAVPASTMVSIAATSADEARPPAAPAALPTGPSERAPTPFARGFWLQLGAFGQHAGALDFQRKVEQALAELAPQLAVYSDRSLHRLQAGPYASRADAQGAAELVRNALKLVPVIVERR